MNKHQLERFIDKAHNIAATFDEIEGVSFDVAEGVHTVIENDNSISVLSWITIDKDLVKPLSPFDLLCEYREFGEHPRWTKAQWLLDARKGQTVLGYWEWAATMLLLPDETDEAPAYSVLNPSSHDRPHPWLPRQLIDADASH